jgi:hypothetical protein
MPKVAMLTPDPDDENGDVEDNVDPIDDEEVEEAPAVPRSLEDLDPETVLWEDGPTAGQILEWKKQYKGVFITNVTFDRHIVWRTLKRSEYRSLVKRVEQELAAGNSQTEVNMNNEELTCEICSLLPKLKAGDFEDDLAGLPSILHQQIMESSGFQTIDVREL